MTKVFFGIICFIVLHTAAAQTSAYHWLATYDPSASIATRIPLPDGFERVQISAQSFGDWLRHLPLRIGKPPVYLFDGSVKPNQEAHVAVIEMDVGSNDLQQCADAIIRLRAEYLFSRREYDKIRFNFTSGDPALFSKWINGFRPNVSGNNVRWVRSGRTDSSYATFQKYLKLVFTYAGSYSLSRESRSIETLAVDDFFIQGGFPGHAVIILDMAVNQVTGKKIFLLAQSYMPAQDMHILVNPLNPNLSPWYEIEPGAELRTPEWTFPGNSAMRFR